MGPARNRARELAFAITFYTRVPLPAVGKAPDPNRVFWALPVVGAVVALIGGAVYAGAHGLGMGPLLSGLLAVAATVAATGALHEDGLADTADGFGGGWSAAQKLAIMRDSRTGAFGSLALVFSVGLRAAAIAAIAEPAAVLAALVAAHALARAHLPWLMRRLPNARAEGLAVEAGHPMPAASLSALGLAAILAWASLGIWPALAALIASALAAAAIGWLARRQIGGYSGDVLGAAEQTGEVTVLLVLAAASQ